MERAFDWILNAAGAGRDQVAKAFRAIHPGSRIEREVIPSTWWDTQLQPWADRGQILAIEFSSFFGNDATTESDRSRAGLVINDADDNTTVTGFRGGSGTNSDGGQSATGNMGDGPGRGGGNADVGPGGGGGHGTLGGTRWNSGPSVPVSAAMPALVTGRWTANSLGMGGSGGARAKTNQLNVFLRGGHAGNGLVRISATDIIESTSRNSSWCEWCG